MANHNSPANAFKKGNQFYQAVLPIRKKSFATPAHLWQAACNYFAHCTDDLIEVCTVKNGKPLSQYKMLPMSQVGLCLYLGISRLHYYKDRPGFTEVMERINAVMQVHNFGCAATGVLNSRIMGHTLQPELGIYKSFLNKSKVLQKKSTKLVK